MKIPHVRKRVQRMFGMRVIEDSGADGGTGGTSTDPAGTGTATNDNGAGNGNAGSGAGGNDSGTGSGTGGDPNGNGSSDNAGFEGEYDAERARALIDKLREENKEKDRLLKEALEAKSKEGEKPKVNDNENDAATIALEKIQQMEARQIERERIAEFSEFAKNAYGLRPEAVAMAYKEASAELQFAADGVTATNMTSVLDALKAKNGFLFVESTKGQQGHGSTGAGGSTGQNGNIPDANEAASAKAFDMTLEEYRSYQSGQRPQKTA